MTFPAAPTPTRRSPRHAPEPPLNPLRYHAMVNPARIPQPAARRRSRRKWPAIAALGVSAVLIASAVAAAPVIAGLLTG